MDGSFCGGGAPVSGRDERLFIYRQPRGETDAVAEVLDGLTASQPRIAAKFFYDSHGACLFDTITTLPEYYLTRAERDIFQRHGRVIGEAVDSDCILIEPGSGSSQKVEMLMHAIRPRTYVPLEITESHLLDAANRLVDRYPWLEVHAVCADYSGGLPMPVSLPGTGRLVFFPGSTIGNFEPGEAVAFLRHLHAACGPGGSLLIGVDLRKDADILNAAYNDADGITARFNLNALTHINGIADGNFDIDGFRHVAFFNEMESRVEMHLESRRNQTVTLGGRRLRFDRGDRIHTENSYKYTLEGFGQLAEAAGFRPREVWHDSDGLFSVHLMDAVEEADPRTGGQDAVPDDSNNK